MPVLWHLSYVPSCLGSFQLNRWSMRTRRSMAQRNFKEKKLLNPLLWQRKQNRAFHSLKKASSKSTPGGGKPVTALRVAEVKQPPDRHVVLCWSKTSKHYCNWWGVHRLDAVIKIIVCVCACAQVRESFFQSATSQQMSVKLDSLVETGHFPLSTGRMHTRLMSETGMWIPNEERTFLKSLPGLWKIPHLALLMMFWYSLISSSDTIQKSTEWWLHK